jgi:hypothetical protein
VLLESGGREVLHQKFEGLLKQKISREVLENFKVLEKRNSRGSFQKTVFKIHKHFHLGFTVQQYLTSGMKTHTQNAIMHVPIMYT